MNRLNPASATICICVLLSGCFDQSPPVPKPTTGGSTPVDRARLTNVKLVDIREPLSWEFGESTVKIEHDGKPIPDDVVTRILGEDSDAARIEADWFLDESANRLKLKNVSVDGSPTEKSAALPITPAGQVRVDLGNRQYNLFRKDKEPLGN